MHIVLLSSGPRSWKTFPMHYCRR